MKPLGIVVTTVGRREALLDLLRSLAPDRDHIAVAIAVQGGPVGLISELRQQGDLLQIDLVVDASSGGASTGRNDAAGWLKGRCDAFSFPNDTTVFPPGIVRNVVTEIDASFRAGAMTVDDPQGAKFTLPERGTPLDRQNVWKVILPGLLMGSETFRALGGFDSGIGTGAPTPWQSGEETAILLRYLDRFGSSFRWLPNLAVTNPHDAAGLSRAARRRKLLGYARGYGRLLRVERYGTLWFLRSLVAGVAFGVRHGSPYSPLDGAWVVRGRLEGWFGRVLHSNTMTALEAQPSGTKTRHAPEKVGPTPNGGA